MPSSQISSPCTGYLRVCVTDLDQPQRRLASSVMVMISGQLSDQNSFSGTGASLVYHKPNLLPIVESTQKGLATLRSLMRVNVMLMNVDDAEFMPEVQFP